MQTVEKLLRGYESEGNKVKSVNNTHAGEMGKHFKRRIGTL